MKMVKFTDRLKNLGGKIKSGFKKVGSTIRHPVRNFREFQKRRNESKRQQLINKLETKKAKLEEQIKTNKELQKDLSLVNKQLEILKAKEGQHVKYKGDYEEYAENKRLKTIEELESKRVRLSKEIRQNPSNKELQNQLSLVRKQLKILRAKDTQNVRYKGTYREYSESKRRKTIRRLKNQRARLKKRPQSKERDKKLHEIKVKLRILEAPEKKNILKRSTEQHVKKRYVFVKGYDKPFRIKLDRSNKHKFHSYLSYMIKYLVSGKPEYYKKIRHVVIDDIYGNSFILEDDPDKLAKWFSMYEEEIYEELRETP
jgi:DNA repair exonuclease SbcCD ATPase subunit